MERRVPDLLKDLQFALRSLRRSPGPTLAIIVTLALGIGPLTAVFSTVYGVLLRPLPYRDAAGLVRLRQPARDGGPAVNFNVPELADYRQRAAALESVVEYHTLWFNLIQNNEPERVQTGVVSWNYFDVLGVPALHGRAFRESDDVAGAPRVLILSHEYWVRRFGGDPDVIGRVVQMNQLPHEIVGVLPRIPRYPNSADDVYMPGSACPFRTPGWLNNRQARALSVFGRLRPGATVDQAERDLAAVSTTLQSEYAESYPAGRRFGLTATPLLDELTANARPTLLLLTGTAALVLLIVCANVANLTLARVLSRERDLALMTALGAPRGAIARRMLTESALMALLGGGVGLALAAAIGPPLAAFAARFSPRTDIGLDWPVLVFALVTSIGTGLVVGAIPALLWKRDPAQALREGSSRGSGGGMRARSMLVAGQVALTCVLLIGAGLLLRSLGRLQSVESGFRPERVLTLRIDLDISRYTAVGRARAGVTDSGLPPVEFWNRLLDEVAREPTLQAGALASTVPLNGGLPQLAFLVRGRDVPAAPTGVSWNVVSDGYLAAAGIPLLSGRDFAATDRQATTPVALVSQRIAAQYWGNGNPIGAHISPGGPNQVWFEVIGVVADVRQSGLLAEPVPQAYVSIRQNPGLGASLLVRSAGDPLSAVPLVRDIVRRVDPFQPVAFVQTLEQVRRDSLAPNRLTAQLLTMFAALALVIAAVGIAGVMSYLVNQRTREIGIRLALGAQPADVRRMVVRHALSLVVAGLLAGTGAAVLLSRRFTSLLFGVSALDPLTYVAVGLLLVGTGVLAVAGPARRSAAIDPLKALQAE